MRKKIIAGALAFSMLLSVALSGCAGTESANNHQAEEVQVTAAANDIATEPATETTTPVDEMVTEPATEPPVETEPVELLTVEQQNSINMLNYLTALVTEINASSSSRVYLESVYDELRNNTNPSVVDSTTRAEYEMILDLLFQYRMITVKRERLQFIYDQNSAAALRSALPSPLSLLNVIQSRNGLQAVVSMLFMAMDSATSYAGYTDEIEMQYLQDSWVLDDEEANNLHNSRKSMFSYMVRIVNDYGLPDNLTLNEASVTRFVEWKNHSNLDQRILFLESNQNDYSAFGDYWLALAESYYLKGEHQKCLEAIKQYLTLSNGIFRKDYKFAKVIPYAVISAKETMDSAAYVKFAEEYAQLLMDNTDQDDWAMRYFVAQTYVELNGMTEDSRYLQQAYDVTLQTLNYLVEEQKSLNIEYLSDLKEMEIPEDATSEEKKTIRAYNKYLKDTRAVATPPVYEPLRLYCDLLFALAEKIDLQMTAKNTVDNILHEQGAALFLDSTLDSMYWMVPANAGIDTEAIEVSFNGDSFTIPAQYVSDVSVVTVKVNGQTVTDWTVKKVDRNKSSDIAAFVATYISESAKDIEYAENDQITLEIRAFDNATAATVFTFAVEKDYVLNVAVSTKFVRV